jgi:uncharacterized protein YneF (UPF0154 family)
MVGLIVCLVVLFLLIVALIGALILQRNVMKELRDESKHNFEEIMKDDQDAKRLDL